MTDKSFYEAYEQALDAVLNKFTDSSTADPDDKEQDYKDFFPTREIMNELVDGQDFYNLIKPEIFAFLALRYTSLPIEAVTAKRFYEYIKDFSIAEGSSLLSEKSLSKTRNAILWNGHYLLSNFGLPPIYAKIYNYGNQPKKASAQRGDNPFLFDIWNETLNLNGMETLRNDFIKKEKEVIHSIFTKNSIEYETAISRYYLERVYSFQYIETVCNIVAGVLKTKNNYKKKNVDDLVKKIPAEIFSSDNFGIESVCEKYRSYKPSDFSKIYDKLNDTERKIVYPDKDPNKSKNGKQAVPGLLLFYVLYYMGIISALSNLFDEKFGKKDIKCLPTKLQAYKTALYDSLIVLNAFLEMFSPSLPLSNDFSDKEILLNSNLKSNGYSHADREGISDLTKQLSKVDSFLGLAENCADRPHKLKTGIKTARYEIERLVDLLVQHFKILVNEQAKQEYYSKYSEDSFALSEICTLAGMMAYCPLVYTRNKLITAMVNYQGCLNVYFLIKNTIPELICQIENILKLSMDFNGYEHIYGAHHFFSQEFNKMLSRHRAILLPDFSTYGKGKNLSVREQDNIIYSLMFNPTTTDQIGQRYYSFLKFMYMHTNGITDSRESAKHEENAKKVGEQLKNKAKKRGQ